MDFENLKEEVTKDKLEKLSDLSYELRVLRGGVQPELKNNILQTLEIFKGVLSIETLNEVVKEFEKKEQLISQQLIPAVLNETGLSEIKLLSGEKIIVEDKVKTSIADKNTHLAFKQMVELEVEKGTDKKQAKSDIESLFKQKINVEYSEEALEMLIEKEIPYETKLEMHWQTLNKYVREKLDSGEKIPEAINCFQYQETKIKEK